MVEGVRVVQRVQAIEKIAWSGEVSLVQGAHGPMTWSLDYDNTANVWEFNNETGGGRYKAVQLVTVVVPLETK